MFRRKSLGIPRSDADSTRSEMSHSSSSVPTGSPFLPLLTGGNKRERSLSLSQPLSAGKNPVTTTPKKPIPRVLTSSETCNLKDMGIYCPDDEPTSPRITSPRNKLSHEALQLQLQLKKEKKEEADVTSSFSPS